MSLKENEAEYYSSTHLIITGKFDPENITQALGIQPSSSWKEGDQDRNLVYSWSGWKHFPPDILSDISLEKQFQYWIDLLSSKQAILERFRHSDFEIELNCLVITNDTASIYFTTTEMKLISNLNVDISFNIIVDGNNPDQNNMMR
jgi:hypothetical protein